MLKGIAFALIAAGLWLLLNVANLRTFLEAYQGRNQELEQVEIAKKRIERLKRQQISLQNNGFEAERHARLDLGMQLPGEKVIVLNPEEPAKTEVPGGAEKTKPEKEKSAVRAVSGDSPDATERLTRRNASHADDSDAAAPAPAPSSAAPARFNSQKRAAPPIDGAESSLTNENSHTMKKSGLAQ